MGFDNLTALVYFNFILQLHLEIRKFGFKKKRGRDRGAEGREDRKREETEQVTLVTFSCFFELTLSQRFPQNY